VDNIRFATPEEVESIKEKSDLQPGCIVLAFENAATGKPDLAVIRLAHEVDPAFFAEGTTDRRKAQFMWALAQHLRLSQVPSFYFQSDVANEAWHNVAKTFGAIQVSPGPEFRFKVPLS
jgi:hypothetical protein